MLLFPILHYAYDFNVELESVSGARRKVRADRVSLPKKLLHHGVIDDRHFRARRGVTGVEFAPGQQRHPHG